jgi:hypothetical protein
VGELLDIGGAVIFLAVAVVSVMRSRRQGDASRLVRAKAAFWIILAMGMIRGLFPDHSRRVTAGYFAAMLTVLLVVLWGFRPRSSDR